MWLGVRQWQRGGVSWKLVIALPDVSAMQQFVNLSDWIKSKFSVGSVPSKVAGSRVSGDRVCVVIGIAD